MNQRSKILFIILVLFVFVSVMYVARQGLNLRREVDREVQKQIHPNLPDVPLQFKKILNIFSPVDKGITWFSSGKKSRSLDNGPGGLLIATNGGLFRQTENSKLARAGRPTGLPFTSIVKVLDLQGQKVPVGKNGVVYLDKDFSKTGWSGQAAVFAKPSSIEIVDAVVDSGELILLGRSGELLRLKKRSCEKLCSLSKGIASALTIANNRYYVGTVSQGVIALQYAHPHCRKTNISGLENAGAVMTMAFDGEQVWVGSANGLFRIRDDHAVPVLERTMINAIAFDDQRIIVGTFDGRIVSFNKEDLKGEAAWSMDQTVKLPGSVTALTWDNGDLLAGTENGIYRLAKVEKNETLKIVVDVKDLGLLWENYITALAFDKGSLLVGGLNTGLYRLDSKTDTVQPWLEKDPGISHIALMPDGNWAVGTTTGLVKLGPKGQILNRMNKSHGLIHTNVTAVLPKDGALYAATAAGLTRIDNGRGRSIYAFHGLINNHLYSLTMDDDEIFVGTLGGLCRVGGREGLTVLGCYNEKDGLAHPWVTALLNWKQKIWAGTYGGGVALFDQEKLRTIKGSQKASVNLNAACSTKDFIVFGTLERGLLFSKKGDSFNRIQFGLPSENITALACRDRTIAVGTDQGLALISADMLEEGGNE